MESLATVKRKKEWAILENSVITGTTKSQLTNSTWIWESSFSEYQWNGLFSIISQNKTSWYPPQVTATINLGTSMQEVETSTNLNKKIQNTPRNREKSFVKNKSQY